MGRRSNIYVNRAKQAKADEFYTRIEDIADELAYYTNAFSGKSVYLPCDYVFKSKFFEYFARNFARLGLKRLVCTNYENREKGIPALKATVTECSVIPEGQKFTEDFVRGLLGRQGNGLSLLEGNGDFRSKECSEILKESDIAVTNPPFSLFRAFSEWLLDAEKSFLFLCNINALKYKKVFAGIMSGEIKMGYSLHACSVDFVGSSEYGLESSFCFVDGGGYKHFWFHNICWITNIFGLGYCPSPMVLEKRYSPADYPKYDNFNAIEVSKTKNIPYDYPGVMGVPITFLDKYNPEQFEIISIAGRKPECYAGVKAGRKKLLYCGMGKGRQNALLNGKDLFVRVFVRLRKPGKQDYRQLLLC